MHQVHIMARGDIVHIHHNLVLDMHHHIITLMDIHHHMTLIKAMKEI